MRYLVWFRDCPEQVEFDNYRDAKHYARLNGGCVTDRETGEVVAEYVDVWY